MFGTDRRIVTLGIARMADAVGNSFLIVVLPLYVASGAVIGEALGLTDAFVSGLVLALAGDLAQEGQSGAQLSVLTVASGLGISFGQLTSGFLIRYGFLTPFAFGGALVTVGVLLVWTQVEDPTPRATVSTTDRAD